MRLSNAKCVGPRAADAFTPRYLPALRVGWNYRGVRLTNAKWGDALEEADRKVMSCDASRMATLRHPQRVLGVPYLFIRVAVADLDPLIVAFGRTSLGALLLLPLALRAGALKPLRPYWKILLIYTAVEIIGPWWLLGHAETRLNSSTTGLIIAVVPIVAAIILTVMGQDRLGARRISGLILGLVGVAFLVGVDVEVSDFIPLVSCCSW